MTAPLPTVRIAWAGAHVERCVVCGCEWRMRDIPVPSVYTVRSVESDDPPEPVCDQCVEKHYSDLLEPLLSERRRFFEE